MFYLFLFNDAAPTEIYTLSLHDALPILLDTSDAPFWKWFVGGKINASYNCVDRHLTKYGDKAAFIFVPENEGDRKSTRLNSSHVAISYAVFCLKKKNRTRQ